jgi:Uma2 family endonuclease
MAMSTALRDPWTVERFLAWEDKQEGRHEFDGADIVPMTGGSRAHQRIIYNLLRLLEERLDHEQFDAVPEMRLRIGRRVRYPDVLVCRGRIPDQVQTLHDAIVVFEILSEDTAMLDRDAKRSDYAHVPGIRRYLLVEQLRRAATVLERTGDQWIETPVVADAIALPELGIELALEDIYREGRFPSSV